jgi:DNA-binding response OmpR family regulator
MDGFTLLREIKKNWATQSIPVVMVTTQVEKQSVLETLKTGAASYVVKPFTPEVTKQKIAESVK